MVLVLVLIAGQAADQCGRLAVQLAGRLQASGLPLVLVANGAPSDVLGVAFGRTGLPAVVGDSEWLDANVLASDVVVMPGGRNGALSTARVTKLVATKGSTIVIVADRESVSTVDLAGERMGLISPLVEPAV